MKQISILDRILLLITGLLAAYQIVAAIEGLNTLAIWCYTIAFGVLLVAVLVWQTEQLRVIPRLSVVVPPRCARCAAELEPPPVRWGSVVIELTSLP